MLLGMWEGRKHSVLESYLFQCKRKEDILGLVHFYSSELDKIAML